MNDLIAQLYDIAGNEEFSPDQRRGLMQIALADYALPLTMAPCEHAPAFAASFPQPSTDPRFGLASLGLPA